MLTRPDAIRLARKLRAEGGTWRDIAGQLEAEGYKSEKTGAPLSPAGALHLATQATTTGKKGGSVPGRRKVKKRAPRQQRAPAAPAAPRLGGATLLGAVKRILTSDLTTRRRAPLRSR